NLDKLTEHVQDNVYVYHLKGNMPSFSEIDVETKLKYYSSQVEAKGSIDLDLNKLDFNNIGFKMKLKLDEVALGQSEKYVRFPNLLLKQSKLNANLYVDKNTKSDLLLVKGTTSIPKLYYKAGNRISFVQPINLNTRAIYNHKNASIQLENSNYVIGNISSGSFDANLKFSNVPYLSSNIRANYIHLEPVLHFASSFSRVNKKESKKENRTIRIPINFDIQLYSGNMEYKHNAIYHLNSKLSLQNSFLSIPSCSFRVSDGEVYLLGKVDFIKNMQSQFDINLENINLEKFIRNFHDKDLVSGKLQAVFRIRTEGLSKKDIKKNLFGTGELNVKDGQLFDKANFLKPIYALDKIISIKKENETLSSFQNMKTTLYIQNETIQIRDFEYKGLGLQAKGKGDVDFSSNASLRITVGLEGLVGKAIKVPIIYNSEKTIAFIVDPIWLTSVYAGTLILAGPAGTVVGGLVGSAVSEDVDTGWSFFKGFFGKKKKSNK
ncbi:MAG: AsmA family protein, partial [Leptospiraceae bacterium]|nr:AsmA family protein [Leptospiraceae bacterium]